MIFAPDGMGYNLWAPTFSRDRFEYLNSVTDGVAPTYLERSPPYEQRRSLGLLRNLVST